MESGSGIRYKTSVHEVVRILSLSLDASSTTALHTSLCRLSAGWVLEQVACRWHLLCQESRVDGRVTCQRCARALMWRLQLLCHSLGSHPLHQLFTRHSGPYADRSEMKRPVASCYEEK